MSWKSKAEINPDPSLSNFWKACVPHSSWKSLKRKKKKANKIKGYTIPKS